MWKHTHWSIGVADAIYRHVETEMVRAIRGARGQALLSSSGAAPIARSAMTERELLPARLSRFLSRAFGQAVSAACAALPIEPRLTDMTHIVQEVLARARADRPRRWVTDASAGDGRGRWDPDRLGMLLTTMLDFAMSEGDVAAPVSVVWLADAERIVVEVENESFPLGGHEDRPTGTLPGSPVQWIELLLARGVAQAHGGELDIQESPTGGILVVLTLPRSAGIPRDGLRPFAAAELSNGTNVH